MGKDNDHNDDDRMTGEGKEKQQDFSFLLFSSFLFSSLFSSFVLSLLFSFLSFPFLFFSFLFFSSFLLFYCSTFLLRDDGEDFKVWPVGYLR